MFLRLIPAKNIRSGYPFFSKKDKTMKSISDKLKNFFRKFFMWGGFNSLILALMQGEVISGLIILVIYQFIIIIFGNHLD